MPEDKKHIFKTANIYLQEGRWDKAIAEFKRLVAMDPEDMSARNILGDAYVKKGLMQEAYAEYVAAAEGHVKRGEGDKANPIYKKIAKLDIKELPSEDQQKIKLISLIVRGDSAYEEGDYETAGQSYSEVVKITPDNIEVTYKLGDICARLGKNREAAGFFLTVAKFYFDGRLFKRALLCYQKVAELDPTNVDARLALADLLAREGQELEARKELQSVTEFYLAQGDIDKAQSCAQRAIQLKSIDAHYLMGEIYVRRNLFDEAKVSLESFLKIKSNHVPAQYALGIALLGKESYDEALAAFGKILGRQADHAESLERVAEIYEKKGSTPDAITQYLSLAQILTTQKIMDRAEAAIRKALDLDSEHLDAHKRLAELFEMRGMRREAGREYLAALKSARAQNVAAEIQQAEEKIKAIDPSLLGGQPAPAAPPAPAEAPSAASPPMEAPSAVSPPMEAPLPAPAPVEAAPPPPLALEPAPSVPEPVSSPALAPAPVLPPVAAAARPAASALDAMALPVSSVPVKPRPKAALTPEQRAQRLMSMAQSALKQKLADEALDMLQQAQGLVPGDQNVKSMIQEVVRGLAGGGKAPPPQAAAPVPPPVAESGPSVPPPVPTEAVAPGGDDIEARIRASLEKQYEEKRGKGVAGSPEDQKARLAETREQVLAHAVSGPGAGASVMETEAAFHLKRGNLEEALRVYEEVLKRAPNRTDLVAKIAEIRSSLRSAPPVPEARPEPLRPVPPPSVAPAAQAAGTARSKPRVSYV